MSEEDYDFMVGFTLFTPKGFKTMYRHFNNLETAKLFASNKNLKDNCKIYVDLNLFNKEKEKNEKLIQKTINYDKTLEKLQKDTIWKDKIRKKVEQIKMNANYDWMYKYDYQDVTKILQELLEED